jgi:hypothetical protein
VVTEVVPGGVTVIETVDPIGLPLAQPPSYHARVEPVYAVLSTERIVVLPTHTEAGFAKMFVGVPGTG